MGKQTGIVRCERLRSALVIIALTIVATSSKPCLAKSKSPAEERTAIRKMADETLTTLYKAKPNARRAIASAAGYAVFDNKGIHVLLLSTIRGGGIAVNRRTKTETFMKMFSGGAGVGAGVKKYRVVFVFSTPQAFERFVNSGWDAGGQTDAAAKSASEGGAYSGAVSVSPGVWVYQLTDKGLALQLTLQGTKYFKNDKLNTR